VERSAERAAANEARFRQANEQIHEKVLELGVQGGRAPYLCECEDERCTTVILLTPEEYEEVRSESRRFIVATGHDDGDARVVDSHDGFTVIEKTGEEGLLVEQLDPRGQS
jgi:hypothetical protein